MAGTKNLGQVAGLFIGTTPPENTSLIWYDSTPSMQCHKVFSVTLGQWVVLDDNTILAVEYSVLQMRAQDPGLSVGQWFKITDKGNALALAITSTKVQYVDSIGNILIDDLSASIQYHVTHQNLLIDDVHGVFDTVNKRLVFEFSEVSAVNFLGDDYFLGERKVDNVWSLFKIKLSKLLSTTSGNTITWDNGFYLNFTQRFIKMLDVTGGAVSKATFDNTIASIRTDLTNVASNQQAVADQAAAAVAAAVTDDMIFSKRLPDAPDVSTGPADILEGDTLQMIVNKAQRWFNSLKWATGIGLSDDYAEATTDFNVSNNDSVETAIAKLAGHVRALQQGSDNGTDNIIVSDDYNPSSDNKAGAGSVLTLLLSKFGYLTAKHETTAGITVASDYNDAPTSDNGSGAGSVLTRLLEKLRYYSIKHEQTDGIWVSESYTPADMSAGFVGRSVTKALGKLAYDINILKTWYNRMGGNVIMPKGSVMMYYGDIDYDTFFAAVGYGWLPAGVVAVAVGSNSFTSEKAKWSAKYSRITFSTVELSHDGSVYTYGLILKTWNGIDIPKVDSTGDALFVAPHNANPGSIEGSDVVTLTLENMPKHNHDKVQPANSSYENTEATVYTTYDGAHHHQVYCDTVKETSGYLKDWLGRSMNSEEEYGTAGYMEYGYNNNTYIKNCDTHRHSFSMYSRGGNNPFDIRPRRLYFNIIIKVV